ncbi:MAG: putative porin [Candidatus Omnitrophica bacterium]|nr:putative porin [Candidatus Omnitrophota bacterium]
MQRKLLMVFTALCVVAGPGVGFAGEVDVLVQKLVDKGILTPYEAQIVLDDTKQEVAKQNAKGTNEAIPSWIQTVKIKGDLRARYQMDSSKNAKTENRGRMRMRLGVEAKPNDKMKVGIGLASGNTGDPRSTNSTWGKAVTATNPGGTAGLILDYAYGEYRPMPEVALTAGKFKLPLWQPNDMLWDTDLNPDGLAAQLDFAPAQGLDVYLNNLVFVMMEDRNSDYSDPVMLAVQPGFKYAITDSILLQGALAYYRNTNLGNRAIFSNSSYSTNTSDVKAINGVSATRYRYNYDAIQPSAEIVIDSPFGEKSLPMIAFSGDYINNLSMNKGLNGRDGWDAAVKFGDKKVSEKGQWQSKLIYARLGRDAFLDVFPDSDRYAGRTNMKSYEAILEYGLGKNTSLGLDYYYGESLSRSGATTNPAQVFQLDWNLKF